MKGFAHIGVVVAVVLALLVVGGLAFRMIIRPSLLPPESPSPLASLPTHDQRFTAILNHQLPQTYTVSYAFTAPHFAETTTIYKASNRLRLDDHGGNFSYERRAFVTPTEYTQCANLPDGWLCYRNPNISPPGSMGTWITYMTPLTIAEGVGYGPGRYDSAKLSQIQINFTGEQQIIGRHAECFDFSIPVIGLKPQSNNCFDTESGLLVKRSLYDFEGKVLPGNIATSFSFNPIPATVFELPTGATLETEITDKVRATFFSEHGE